MLKILLFQTNPPPPPDAGDTGIDELPIDGGIILGLVIGLIIIIHFYYEIQKKKRKKTD